MTQSQFSLSWSAHNTNICNGLSSLQQNGEFVDMTLAADGHHVKVHQVIMALASPYIKELISTAQCPHPVIFLNKVSYTTLSSILEYIYTGEVLIPVESLTELMEAGRDLHIKGLEDMDIDSQNKRKTITTDQQTPPTIVYEKSDSYMKDDTEELSYFEVMDTKLGDKYMIYSDTRDLQNLQVDDSMIETVNERFEVPVDEPDEDIQPEHMTDTIKSEEHENSNINSPVKNTFREKFVKADFSGPMQYTVSNQGSLQLILNRFVYYLKHTKRCGTRQWRCVDYLSTSRCPAILVTKDDTVIQRLGAHVHTFHDKKILKKVKSNAIYSAIHEAIREGHNKKHAPSPAPAPATAPAAAVAPAPATAYATTSE